MIKVLTVFGTRPEIIKISTLIEEIDKHFQQVLVNTNQNFDPNLNKIFLKELKIRNPDYNLDINNINQSVTIAEIIIKTREILIKEKPDIFLVYGDTNSAYASISAKELKIPIFHMEAGNRSYDQRIPEEINRKIIDHISDVNIVLSEQARNNLLKEGFDPKFILKSGSHMEEVLSKYKSSINKSSILKKLNLKKNSYFLVSLHRAEFVDNQKNINEIILTLKQIAEIYKLPIIISTHPRLKKRIKEFNIKIKKKNIIFLSPFGFFDYIKLCENSFCVISDSGSLYEESYLLKFPAVSVRKSHERIEGMETGSVVLSGYKENIIIQSIRIATQSKFTNTISDYNGGDVSKKIVKYMISYFHKVNEQVWFK